MTGSGDKSLPLQPLQEQSLPLQASPGASRWAAAGPSLLVVAVEASGDLHAAAVLRELNLLRPGIQAFGAAGPLLRAEGCEALVKAETLGVMGIAEVLPALPRLWRAFRTLLQAARERRPGAALLVDSPDFNLRLAARLRPLGEGPRVVYFIGPSVWAWRTYRVRQIARDVFRMLVILPFEEAFYAAHGVRATYVGNPLVDRLLAPTLPAGPGPAPLAERAAPTSTSAALGPSAARAPLDLPARLAQRAALGLDPARPVLALLPGSRRQELRRLWRPLLEAGQILLEESPGLQLVVPVAPSVERAPLEAEASALGLTPTFLEGRAAELLSCADAAAVASGTATLEAALEGVPLVVVYQTSWLTWLVGRLLVRVRFVSLVNLLAGRALVPELLQRACTPERIAAALRLLLAVGPERREQLRGFDELRALLAPPGQVHAARRAAQELLSVLDEAP